jgi:hypothetical protein
MFAPADLQTAVYKVLVEDVQLAQLLGAYTAPVPPAVDPIIIQKVFDFVPDNEAYPFITIQILPGQDRGSHTTEGFEFDIQVSVWTSDNNAGNKRVYAIQKRIDYLLHKNRFSMTENYSVMCRRTLVDILKDPDNITRQGVQRFRVFTTSCV